MKYNSNQTKYEKLSKSEKKENYGDVKNHPESEVRPRGKVMMCFLGIRRRCILFLQYRFLILIF